MISWICRQLDCRVRDISEINFRNKGWGYSGHCWIATGRIVVSTGTKPYPCGGWTQTKATTLVWDLEEALVMVTAHEIAHRWLYKHGVRGPRGSRGGGENNAEWHAQQLLDAFRANRDELLSRWQTPPQRTPVKPKPTLQKKRAVAAQAMLAKWQRKLKLAQTKVKQYRKKTRYYESATAAKRAK
jgi:hypothetical protein